MQYEERKYNADCVEKPEIVGKSLGSPSIDPCKRHVRANSNNQTHERSIRRLKSDVSVGRADLPDLGHQDSRRHAHKPKPKGPEKRRLDGATLALDQYRWWHFR